MHPSFTTASLKVASIFLNLLSPQLIIFLSSHGAYRDMLSVIIPQISLLIEITRQLSKMQNTLFSVGLRQGLTKNVYLINTFWWFFALFWECCFIFILRQPTRFRNGRSSDFCHESQIDDKVFVSALAKEQQTRVGVHQLPKLQSSLCHFYNLFMASYRFYSYLHFSSNYVNRLI